jgi:two-component system, NarL family, response regulator DesR
VGVRILVVEDHQLVGAALCGALAGFDDLDILGVETTFDGALEAARCDLPDVVLVDLRLGSESALDRLPELARSVPAARALVVTAWATEHAMAVALAAGARGLLSKAQPLESLVDGIRRVHAGELVVCPELVPALVRRATGQAVLDVREMEVITLLAGARSTPEIAERLCLSRHTVRNRIAGSMAKLGVHSRVELVCEATRRGLVLPDEPALPGARR